ADSILRPSAFVYLRLVHRPEFVDDDRILIIFLEQSFLQLRPLFRHVLPYRRPLRQDVLVQLALTIGEKLVEYRLYVGRRDDRLSAGVAQRGSHLDENIVAGGLRIRVRAVEMDVAGRRAVETVGKLIESRVFVGCDLAALVVLGDGETLVAALPLLAAI